MIGFVRGDWAEVPTGALCVARYSVVQTKDLPKNWTEMSDETKMAWGEANRASAVEVIDVYYQSKDLYYRGFYQGLHLGQLAGAEVFEEVRSAIRMGIPIYCELVAPWSFDPDLGAKGHVVKIYTGEWARVFFKRRRREQFLNAISGWSFALASIAVAGVAWLWLRG